MERKGGNRGRVVNLRAVKNKSDRLSSEGPIQEVVGISLGDRMVFSEQAEVWTVKGHLRDGSIARENIGELSFVLIPGVAEPATAIVGFIAPSEPYVLGVGEDALWPQLRSMVVQLGYDLDGFYASIAFGGRYAYFEEYRRDR
jgi:hypothetical protein